MEVIILAGWLGTRLSYITQYVPKPMAVVSGKPFLVYILDSLIATDMITNIILSVWYKYQIIKDFFGSSYRGVPLQYCVEEELLWTGGAINKALSYTIDQNVLIMNWDTYFDINFSDFFTQHNFSNADISLALKPMSNFERYGNVVLEWTKVIAFEEKKFTREGNINGWIYYVKRSYIEWLNLPEKFSLESDILTLFCSKDNYRGFIYNAYFIDIGIPEDYERANKDFSN